MGLRIFKYFIIATAAIGILFKLYKDLAAWFHFF